MFWNTVILILVLWVLFPLSKSFAAFIKMLKVKSDNLAFTWSLKDANLMPRGHPFHSFLKREG